MKHFPISLLILVLLSACSLDVRKYGSLDKNDKSITIPAGGNSFLLALKDYFFQNGWKVENFRGADVTEKKGDSKLKYETFNTRYVLFGEYHLDEKTLYGARLEKAEMSIIDTKSRHEILIFKCGRMTVDSFIADMSKHISEAMP